MYVIRDKNIKLVLKIHKAPLADELSPEEVFSGFDPQTMEMGKHAHGRLPKYFDIDEEGFIQRLTKRQFEKLLEVDEGEGITMATVNANDPSNPDAIAAAIEAKIAERYPTGRELKIMKGYLDWISEDKPANDIRLKKYRTMQRYIGRVKESFENT